MSEGDSATGDEVEVVEIGEGDIAILLAALKRLNSGVYALKVTLDFLNSRIGALPERIRELEDALKAHEDFFSQESKRVSENLQRHGEGIRSEYQELVKNLRLQLDLFIEKLSSQLQEVQGFIATISQDINMIMSKLREVEVISTDTSTAVKGEVKSLSAKIANMELTLNELSQRISKLEETQLTMLREYSLQIQELSLKLTGIEKMLKDSCMREAGS
jgi:predicted  nucleic acid-binding Zn-ribbon protein